jgi:hypothetical protein
MPMHAELIVSTLLVQDGSSSDNSTLLLQISGFLLGATFGIFMVVVTHRLGKRILSTWRPALNDDAQHRRWIVNNRADAVYEGAYRGN